MDMELLVDILDKSGQREMLPCSVGKNNYFCPNSSHCLMKLTYSTIRAISCNLCYTVSLYILASLRLQHGTLLEKDSTYQTLWLVLL